MYKYLLLVCSYIYVHLSVHLIVQPWAKGLMCQQASRILNSMMPIFSVRFWDCALVIYNHPHRGGPGIVGKTIVVFTFVSSPQWGWGGGWGGVSFCTKIAVYSSVGTNSRDRFYQLFVPALQGYNSSRNLLKVSRKIKVLAILHGLGIMPQGWILMGPVSQILGRAP